MVLDGEFYEIQEFIEGAPYEHASWAHLRAAAVMLARYHTSVQGFAIQALSERGDLYSPTILTENLTSLKEAWELDQEPTLIRIVQQLESHASDLVVRFGEHEELPHLVIHGDYYGGNLLFKGDRIVGVVDYDKACWQPRIVELAEALIYFASPLLGHLKHVVYSGFIEWDRFTSLLHHYTCAISSNAKASVQDPIALRPASVIVGARSLEETRLGAKELRALPDYIRCIWLSTSLQRLLEEGPQPADAQEVLREVLALGDWSAAHTQRMIETGNRVMAAV